MMALGKRKKERRKGRNQEENRMAGTGRAGERKTELSYLQGSKWSVCPLSEETCASGQLSAIVTF